MRYIKGFAAGLLLFTSAGISLGQDTLQLTRAIAISLQNNYSIKIAENEREIAGNNNTIGNAGMLPFVNANATQNFTIEDTRQEFIEDRVQEVSGARSRNFNANVTLGWTIFDGMAMFITRDKLAELEKFGEANFKVQVENTIRDVNLAYHQIVVQQEKLKTLQDALGLSAQRVDIARTKYEVGRTSKLEYLAAQVDYNEDTSAYIMQVDNLHNAKVDLNQLLGIAGSPDFAVRSSIQFVDSMEREELYEEMMLKNATRRTYVLNKNVSHLEMKEIRTERLPSLDLNSAYSRNTSAAESGFLLNRRANGFSFGFSATWNIFNGFNLNRRIQNAKINLETADWALRQNELALQSELEKTYATYKSSLMLYRLETENVEVARENREIAFERYRLGNSTAIEFREAQLNLIQAENRLLDAAYAVKVAEIELLRLSGNIL